MRNSFRPFLVLATLALTGCNILPEAQPDPTRFYVLESEAPVNRVETATRLVVGVRAVEVPGYLRSRSMVVRVGGNEVKFVDTERWAETLETAVTRLVSERLSGRVEVAASLRGAGKRDADITINLVNCEGTSDGGIRFVATYTISRPQADGSTLAETHQFTAIAAQWDGSDYSQLAKLLSAAAVELGDEIAGKF